MEGGGCVERRWEVIGMSKGDLEMESAVEGLWLGLGRELVQRGSSLSALVVVLVERLRFFRQHTLKD